jgi:serine protease Do
MQHGSRDGRRARRTGWRIALVLMVLAGPAPAQTPALAAEYDARAFSGTEKRILQLGLTIEGHYVGLLDGLWGAASQAAIERFAAAIDQTWTAVAKVRFAHAALLAARAQAFIAEHDLAYAAPLARGHHFAAPQGRFVPDPDPEWKSLVLQTRHVRIDVLNGSPILAEVLHDVFSEDLAPRNDAYLVRNPARLVTAYSEDGWRTYIRSDRLPGGLCATIFVFGPPDADPRVFDVVVASITVEPDARLHARGGPLDGLVAAVRASASPSTAPPLPTPADPDIAATARPAPPDAVAGSGTAFFVNNTDLVTAAHVVEGCARLTLTDGTELSVIALHPRLDLALLASPRRSRSWIPVHLTGSPNLGQRIVVLGYPFYGTFGTALSATGGNVSALAGMRDDPAMITISAPVQPGNSGGPLLAVNGSVIGVVVARLDALRVAEATGDLPENINYAVTGRELLAFLEAEGVSLPRQVAGPVDFDAGIPESHQRAVVPVLCDAP